MAGHGSYLLDRCIKIWLFEVFVTNFIYNQTIFNQHHNSVTRFGDLLDFGQLFKAFGNN